MKKYHFQENEKDFGSTVRLDAINDKVKEIKKKEETDELGDASEFLNVFESEKFDDPAETDGNTEDALVDTLEDADALEDALGETRRDGVFPAPAEEEGEEDYQGYPFPSQPPGEGGRDPGQEDRRGEGESE